mmetsp:Transcript_46668/g.56083  ORF Transcript_46668/g.56083 Transcript_46668/m.56083 type:complete len:322 (+) Transcript_46668:56-1021(+)|eukprot:CAMPEP_0194352810 /NCGR_PEP_ID=MMETSP0174-20130528/1252_1 /TAXON_ID=216777 /ORGANISM="Proboscia alata, Strain PI-D3" /LENGTH=321 /DNA_ID=CAMNT_0039121109 /DNA_START=55 /DNA_END=1020 /DNA_ORIENTATION=-
MALFAAPQFARDGGGNSFKIEVMVEKWRCFFYFFFLSMILLAGQITNRVAAPILAAGAPEGTPVERLGCGPFNRGNSSFGFGYGDGFPMEQSHLEEAFGYPNTCTAWDYSPAREIIAMYFPALEYSMVIYLVFNFITDMLSHQRGSLPDWYWNASKVLFPIAIFLAIQFRMIFVLIAYENIKTHTAAFLGFQFTIVIIAIMNTFYVILTGQSYPEMKMNAKVVGLVAKVYLVLNMLISAVKISATAYAVATGTVPDLLKTDVFPGTKWVKLIDTFYMFFNVVLPLCISYVRMKSEEPLVLEITMPKHNYEGASKEEQSRII